MQLELTLSDALAEKVKAAAAAAGLSPGEYAERVLKAAAFRTDVEALQRLLKPAFDKAGVQSDDDVYDLVS